MKLTQLTRLVGQSIRRNRRDFLLSSIGIIVGISTLFFFTALGAGIKDVVLEKIFVVRQLEVVNKTYDVAGMRTSGLLGGTSLTDKTVDRLSRLDGVAQVYPKMKLTFPASVRGGKKLLGKNMIAELIADGIPAETIDRDDIAGDLAFRDWTRPAKCSDDHGCPGGFRCADDTCQPRQCTAESDRTCSGKSYCDTDAGTCTLPIPVVASPKMLELYNGSFQTAMGGASGLLSKLPKLSETTLVGLRFDGVFGRSFLGRSARGDHATHRMEFVGFSDKAIDLGATIPMGYVKRLNAKFGNRDQSDQYQSVVVKTDSNDDVARVAKQIKDMGFGLSDRYDNAQRAGLLIMLLTAVFNLISIIILTISAINIMHTFMMVILERRQELGLMRAVGATRADIRALMVGEASLIGIFGGVVGVSVGWAVIRAIDYLFATRIANFPFKPDSLFIVDGWTLPAAVGLAVVFCWLGAIWPAFQAARVDPARTLSGS